MSNIEHTNTSNLEEDEDEPVIVGIKRRVGYDNDEDRNVKRSKSIDQVTLGMESLSTSKWSRLAKYK